MSVPSSYRTREQLGSVREYQKVGMHRIYYLQIQTNTVWRSSSAHEGYFFQSPFMHHEYDLLRRDYRLIGPEDYHMPEGF